MPDAVFFDLDGTLLDTAPDFHVVLNELLEERGRPTLEIAQVRTQVSNGARALVTLAFQVKPGEQSFDYWLERLLERYAQRLDVDTRLFPGMEKVLDFLVASHIPWGVVTNKSERFARPILEGLGLAETLGPLVCPEHVKARKPDPEGLLLASQQAGARPRHSIYVGDHARDIQAGRNACMQTIAACYGYLDKEEDPAAWNADYYIDEAAMLLPLLEEMG